MPCVTGDSLSALMFHATCPSGEYPSDGPCTCGHILSSADTKYLAPSRAFLHRKLCEAVDQLRGVLILVEAEQSETCVMGLLKMFLKLAMKPDDGPDQPAVHGVAV